MDIKVIKGLKPWDVIKRASEGEDWAWNLGGEWIKSKYGFDLERMCGKVSNGDQIAIIDTTAPEICWDKFDWDFFNQYGGIPIYSGAYEKDDTKIRYTGDEHPNCYLLESPFYYWPGGEQPVSDGVEVEVVFRDHFCKNMRKNDANKFDWRHSSSIHSHNTDIIAFKLTGRVL